jgi:hypothetical protein
VSLMAKKLAGIAAAVAVVGALIGFYVADYLLGYPKAFAANAAHTVAAGATGSAQLTLASVPAAGSTTAHPTWVSYFAIDAHGRWQHTTLYKVPAHSLVHVTIYNYDGASGLRNPFISQAQGLVGSTFTLNGKPTVSIDPTTASHVFAIAQLGVSVPLPGVPTTAKNPCSAAPCTLSQDHQTISFTFRTGKPGIFRWQCLVPCAAGFILGFGGPMATTGYMDGFVQVV